MDYIPSSKSALLEKGARHVHGKSYLELSTEEGILILDLVRKDKDDSIYSPRSLLDAGTGKILKSYM